MSNADQPRGERAIEASEHLRGVGRADASDRAALLVKMLTASAVGMVVVLPIAFVFSYMLNDMVSWSDHVVALVIVASGVLLLVGIHDNAVREVTRLSSRRCFVIGLGGQTFVPLLLGAIYALLSMLPALDSAVGYTATNATCLMLFATLGIASAAALVAVRGLMVDL